jgi:crotonobetainyl-CoA:carnitine CoA-transferase CaiB-like acyl-CoA transferase
LLRRERTGAGAHLDVALAESALAWQAHSLPAARVASEARGHGLLTGGLACYDVYECADGRWVTLAAIEPKFFARVCELLKAPDLAPLQFDAEQQVHLRAELAKRFAKKTSLEWDSLMATDETCVTLVRTRDEVLSHPQFAARNSLTSLYDDDAFPAPASPFVVDGSRTS